MSGVQTKKFVFWVEASLVLCTLFPCSLSKQPADLCHLQGIPGAWLQRCPRHGSDQVPAQRWDKINPCWISRAGGRICEDHGDAFGGSVHQGAGTARPSSRGPYLEENLAKFCRHSLQLRTPRESFFVPSPKPQTLVLHSVLRLFHCVAFELPNSHLDKNWAMSRQRRSHRARSQ